MILILTCLIANSPFTKQKNANESFVEWGKYMNEMLEEKKSEIRAGSTQDGMDLMGQSAYIPPLHSFTTCS